MSTKSLYIAFVAVVILFCLIPLNLPGNSLDFGEKSMPWIQLLLLKQPEKLQYIAYHRYVNSYRDLYIVKEDGTGGKALATSINEDVLYADNIDNGARIIFMRGVSWLDKMGIYAINSDGSGFNKIIDSPSYEGYWSKASNGRFIIFRWDGNAGACADYDLYSINPDGTGLVTLYNSPEFDIFHASTMDNRVIFTHRLSNCGNSNLYSIKADGTGLVTIGASADNYYFNTLTTDNRVIFTHLKNGSNYDLYSIKTNGTDLSTIGNSALNEAYQAISNDNHIIYTTYDNAINRSYMFITDTDGGNKLNLIPSGVEGSIQSVETTDSSSKIVFRSSINNAFERLYVINFDGTGYRLINSIAGRYTLCGITKTNRILFGFYQSSPPVNDIKSILLDGSGEKSLANSPDAEVCEAISPDGRLIFSRFGGGSNWDLYSINPDGTNMATIADTSDDEYFMGVTSNNRIIFSRRGDSFGQPHYPDDNVDLYSIKTDGTSKIKIAGSNDSESFAAIF